MIKFNAKSTLLKTIILVMVSASMLVSSSYAWFITTSMVSVDQLTAGIDGTPVVSQLVVNEAIDANYNGIRDMSEEYIYQLDGVFTIPDMMPGKTNFYKIDISTEQGATNAVKLNTITVAFGGEEFTLGEGETIADNYPEMGARIQSVLSKIEITIDNGLTISKTSFWELIDDTSTYPYSATLAAGIITMSQTIKMDISVPAWGLDGPAPSDANYASGTNDDGGIHNDTYFKELSLSLNVALETQTGS